MVWDFRLGRARPTEPRDMVDMPRLVQALPHIDGAGTLVAPNDIPGTLRNIIVCRNRMIRTIALDAQAQRYRR